MIVRKSLPKDRAQIDEILSELDLAYDALSFDDVWIVEDKGRIIGVAELVDYGNSFLLSAVGTSESERGRGVAARLLGRIMDGLDKPVYLYTLIPEFFARFGFKPAGPKDRPPPREIYNCKACDPSRCVCMVKEAK